MKKQVLKKLTALSLTVLTLLSLAACGQKTGEGNAYKVGICSYVDDASLNQINENVQAQRDRPGAGGYL